MKVKVVTYVTVITFQHSLSHYVVIVTIYGNSGSRFNTSPMTHSS